MKNQLDTIAVRYKILVSVAATALAGLIIGLVISQYASYQNDYLSSVSLRLKDKATAIEKVVARARHQVSTMDGWLEGQLNSPDDLARPRLLNELRQCGAECALGPYFELSKNATGWSGEPVGNLFGMGMFDALQPNAKRLAQLMPSLFNLHENALKEMPNITWVYFLSSEYSLVAISPFNEVSTLVTDGGSGTVQKLFDAIAVADFNRLGLSQHNQKGLPYWTEAYMGHVGEGLIITHGAPVYRKGQFQGVVGVDFSLNFLDDLLKDFGVPEGELIVANGRGMNTSTSDAFITSNTGLQALAATPRAPAHANGEITAFSVMLPEGMGQVDAKQLLDTKKEFRSIGAHYVISYPVSGAPWTLVFIVPKSAVIAKTLSGLSAFLFALLGTAILLVATYFASRRYFVEPAKNLAAYVSEASEHPAAQIPKTPKFWQPHFTKLEETFTEKERLLELAKNHVGTLNKEVARQTEELREAVTVAETANTAKSKFLAAASHDLRQPLQAISLFVAALKQSLSRPADGTHRINAETINSIEGSLARLGDLLNALLDVSKLEAGAIKPNINSFPIQNVLLEISNRFDGLAVGRGLSLIIRPNDTVISSDLILLGQILENLVSNALRYTKQGKVLVGCQKRGGLLRISVWDTGIGIPSAQLDDIFEEFSQLDNEPRLGEKGFGLGLAIVSRTAALLGHQIDVRSRVGRGSMFSVTVPIAAKVASNSAVKTEEVFVPFSQSPKIIGVIEDDLAVLNATTTLIEAWGHRVIACADAGEAFSAFDNPRDIPDLLVIDFRLPGGIKGTNVFTRINAAKVKKIPGILISGETGPVEIAEFAASGMAHLSKPINADHLKRLIESG